MTRKFEPILKKEKGVWVYRGEPSRVSIPDLVDRKREERCRDLLRLADVKKA